jgi:cephalosporin-C deacetylase-like acetyl esterase
MLAHDHLGRTPDGYDGAVQYDYGMPEKNFYSILKVDETFLKKMRDNLLPAPEDADLEKYDIYRVYLKSPGPCHSSGFITVPKDAEPKSLPIHFVFDGYGVYSAEPILAENEITVHCTHHGYELGEHRDNYYVPLNQTVCHYYGRGINEVNAGYEDISDCYMTYLLIRDLQMVHFSTTPELCADIAGLTEKYSGKAIISGGSMGGYQSICIGGLVTLLNEKRAPIDVVKIIPNIPAFCNIAGHTEGRVKTYLTTYVDGVDYYDAAQFAHLIGTHVEIPRMGLGDDTCPAGGIIAMINALGGSCDAKILQNSSHGFIPDERFQQWYKYSKT